ncbi:hypothetical protein [Streptomyces sp. AM6-12]|uniref:hypothetical protein n=1 Tax=Streptomyces sp. AM6-12 TaxID=3345149 RepID=UPI00378A34EA
MTSLPSRRSLLGKAVAAAGGALLLSQTGRAFAAPQTAARRALLPEVGQTFNLSLNAFGATLAVNVPPPLPRLNFIGSIVQKVLVGGLDFVRLQTLGFTMEAFHPLYGKITLQLPDVDVTPASILSMGPGGLTETWLESFKATFERNGDTPGPFIYETLEPAKWVASNLPPVPAPAPGDGLRRVAHRRSLVPVAVPHPLGHRVAQRHQNHFRPASGNECQRRVPGVTGQTPPDPHVLTTVLVST